MNVDATLVSFDGSSSTASDGSNLILYDWDFGDGNSSTGISPTYEYPIDGVYVISLTVTDNMGESDISFCTITVEGSKVHNYARGKCYYKIQYALDDAESQNWIGDTIDVDPGSFNEDINIRVPVDLIGSGIDATFIDGGDNDTIDIFSEFVNISGFNISGNGTAIDLGKDDCKIFNNSISAQVGIEIYAAANSTISNNSMFRCSIFLNSGDLEDYNNLIVLPSNTVNGRPVYYYKDAVGILIPPNAGEIILINCTDMEITNQHFFNATVGYEVIFSSNITVNNTNSSFNLIGGIVVRTFNSTVSNCTMFNNSGVGLYLVYFSHNNTVRLNTLINNENGMIIFDSVDNWIYHNSFINNTVQAYDDTDANHWNSTYPTGGNYWSDYNGTDTMFGPWQDQTGPDGIGDTPYNNTCGQGIQGGMAEDYYPLMSPEDFEDIINPTSEVDLITPYWYNTSPLAISATAIDTRSDVASVGLWYNFEGGTYELFETDTLAPWEWDFDWPEGEGNYTFYSIAEDTSGNIESVPVTEDASVGYDTAEPTSEVNSITQYWQDDSLTITAMANDGISGVASVELFTRYSVDNITWNDWASFGLNSSLWSWNFSFSNGAGYYEFYTIATDNTGNIEAVPSVADTICAYDSGAPEIVDSSTVSATTGEVFTVTVLVEDGINVTSVHVVYWFENGTATNSTAILVSSNTYELDIQIPSDCSLNLQYKIAAVDHLGKWNSTTEKTVMIVDNDAPSADAGSDQIVVENTIVIFDGSSSADNIEIINYTWVFSISGATITLYGPNPQYNFTVSENYSVILTVSDAAGNIDNDTLTITVQLDTDGDGIGNNEDPDDDNDGYLDEWEIFLGTDPDDSDDTPLDTDNDGIPDGDETNTQTWMDTDDDNDGVPDTEDFAPLDPDITTDPNAPSGGTGNYWWIAIIIVIAAILGAAFMLARKPPPVVEEIIEEPTLETELCPKCGFDIEPGSPCPFCVEEKPPEPEPPKPAEVPKPKPKFTNEEMLEMIEKSYQEGKLTEEQYLKNMKKFS